MKVEEIFESYGEFEQAIKQSFMNSGLVPQESMAAGIARNTREQFQEFSRNNWITGREKDVGYWVGKLNRDPLEVRSLRSLIDETREERVPEYAEGETNYGRVYEPLNFPAAKTLCRGMSVCIATSKQEFENYTNSGALFVMRFNTGLPYVIETNHQTGDFAIWNRNNDEIEPRELVDEEQLRSPISLRSGDLSDDRDLENAIMHINMEIMG